MFNRAALPRIRATDSCWKSLWMVVLSSSPFCRASALPSFATSVTAVGCHAPRLSTAMGMNSMPCLWHSSQDLSSFRFWAVLRAWPGVVAAPWTNASWRESVYKLRGVQLEAEGGQDHFEVRWVQDLLLLWQGVPGGALEEDPQAALQAPVQAESGRAQLKGGIQF